MSAYPIHTVESAPEDAKPLLQGLQNSLGMVPNLAAAMAESPKLLKGFLQLRALFYGGSFSPGEVQVLALTNAYENSCEYCMSLHSFFALQEGISSPTVAALRQGKDPAEPRLAALSRLSRKLVAQRGQVGEDDLAEFLAAGFTRAQALEVVLGVAVSVLPNFAHHLTHAPIDEAFQSQLWQRQVA